MNVIFGTKLVIDIVRQVATTVISKQISSTFSSSGPTSLAQVSATATPPPTNDGILLFRHNPRNNIETETVRILAFLQQFDWPLYYSFVKQQLSILSDQQIQVRSNVDDDTTKKDVCRFLVSVFNTEMTQTNLETLEPAKLEPKAAPTSFETQNSAPTIQNLILQYSFADNNTSATEMFLCSINHLLQQVQLNYETILQKIKFNKTKFFKTWRHTNYEPIIEEFVHNYELLKFRLGNFLQFYHNGRN